MNLKKGEGDKGIVYGCLAPVKLEAILASYGDGPKTKATQASISSPLLTLVRAALCLLVLGCTLHVFLLS